MNEVICSFCGKSLKDLEEWKKHFRDVHTPKPEEIKVDD